MITQNIYIKYRFCPKWAYYLLHNSDKITAIFNNTNVSECYSQRVIDQFIKNFFPDIVTVPYVFDDNNDKNYISSAHLTKQLLNNSNSILNATFIYKDLCCHVDILVKNKDNTFDIYKFETDKLSMDMSFTNSQLNDPLLHFQIYILKKCGLNIRLCHYICLNKFFQHNDNIEQFQLFIPCMRAGTDWKSFEDMEKQINLIRNALDKQTEPTYSLHCSLNTCPFFEYCHKDLKDSVSLVRILGSTGAYKCFKNKIFTLYDLANNLDTLIENRVILPYKIDKIKRALNAQSNTYIEKGTLNVGFSRFKYPICFLELKTISDPIPQTKATTPYQNIIFMYSLYIQDSKDDKITRKEYLCNDVSEEPKLIKQLCIDIPQDSTIVYYKNNEFTDLFGETGSLINKYPNNRFRLVEFEKNSFCLQSNIFNEFLYYDKIQNGSSELNAVLYSLIPEFLKEIKSLPIINNDNDLIKWFLKLNRFPESKEKDNIKNAMLNYCGKLAQSSLLIWNKLNSLVNKK